MTLTIQKLANNATSLLMIVKTSHSKIQNHQDHLLQKRGRDVSKSHVRPLRLMTCQQNGDIFEYQRRKSKKLISVFHCSKIQAIAGVIETANHLFGRQWKYHDEDEDFIDFDTAPCFKTIRETGKAIEAFALKCIVDEMMKADDVVITYHDDGSKKKGAGSFSVQGLTINGVFRALPTLPVASESRDNLAALKKAVLGILSICSGVSSKDLFNKINFRMMDSTAHNYGVDEQVALDLGTDHIPEELLCSTHPTLMFNREMIGVCSTVETTIGRGKIHSTLLVDATTTHDTVCEQLIDVMMRLVSHDFDSKQWNKALDFEKHISPKRSKAVELKKE